MPVPLFSTNKWVDSTATALALVATPEFEAHLLAVAIKIDAVPTTPENVIIWWHNPDGGANYSTELMRTDPATEAIQNVVYLPESKLVIAAGDTIEVTYSNSDSNTVTAQIVMEVGR